MEKCVNGVAPAHLGDCFTTNDEIHLYNKRSRHLLTIRQALTNSGQRISLYKGASEYNKLPINHH